MKSSFLILITIVLNNFFPTFLMFIFFILDSNIIGVEIALLTSGLNIICQIFSLHGRNIILTSKSFDFSKIFYDRVILSLIILFIFFCIINLTNISFLKITISFSPIILIFWINEILISILEKEKKVRYIFNICFLIILYISIVIFLIIFENLISLIFINLFFSIIFLINLYIFLKEIVSFNNFSLNNLIKIDIKSISSFFLVLPVFVWRIFIYENYNVDIAAMYFMCFAIASLPGTLLLNIIGVSLIRLNLTKIFKLIILGMISLIIFNIIFRDIVLNIINSIFSSINEEEFFITLLFSLIGSIFLILGVFERCIKFVNFKSKFNIYKVDILNAFLVSIIVPIIIVLLENKLIHFSFMISGLINFINYKFVLNDKKS